VLFAAMIQFGFINLGASSFNFQSPVLKQVYPALLEYKQEFGHPNVPLGNTEGRQCETLRRLHIQEKLTEEEVNALTELGFRWLTLEDVYKTADFDDMYKRLKDYFNDTNDFPPKKYPADPELGAWVTGVRRLGQAHLDHEHAARLNEMGFQWTSNKNCGSAFMKAYREYLHRLEDTGDNIFVDETVKRWIRAQQFSCNRGTLSETRKHYMVILLSGITDSWMEWEG
jgi:hypothetical protein